MNILKFIQSIFCSSKNVANDDFQGQNLSDVPLRQDLCDPPLVEDELVSTNASIEETVRPLPEVASDEKSTDELKSIVSELEHESEVGTDKKSVIGDKVQKGGETPQTCDNSLLDDAAYMALAEKCCDIISELDTIQTEENADMSDMVKTRIKEALLCSGAEPISDESSFDILRHKAEGKSIVRKGTPISATIEPGVAIGDKVMIKAKVEIKKKD